MKLAVFGDTARNIGAIAARLAGVSDVIPVTSADAVDGEGWIGLVVDGEADGAARIARTALANGQRVLLVGIPKHEPGAWTEPARDGLTLSRPLRFDPHIARASEVVRGGTIGAPRTLELCWSFAGDDASSAVTELVDVACALLDSGPAAIYAAASEVTGPPLIKVNVLTASGAFAVIEAAAESDDLPARRDLHLLATDGEIAHRIGQDDLLWSEGRARPLPGATATEALQAQEIAVWIDGGSDGLARGLAVGWNVAVG
ncbi:MAG TPA: hypothetical protein VKB09_03690, partial [Thermomicrobiales bacterium]|nr:hypothetical protein [Thermomicrobiales bacterium]